MLLNIQDDTAGCSASLKVKEGPPKLLLYPQAAWSWMSRQQEDELTALKEVVASVRAFGVAPEVAVALDIQQGEQMARAILFLRRPVRT